MYSDEWPAYEEESEARVIESGSDWTADKMITGDQRR